MHGQQNIKKKSDTPVASEIKHPSASIRWSINIYLKSTSKKTHVA